MCTFINTGNQCLQLAVIMAVDRTTSHKHPPTSEATKFASSKQISFNQVSNCHFCNPPLWPSFFGTLLLAILISAFCLKFTQGNQPTNLTDTIPISNFQLPFFLSSSRPFTFSSLLPSTSRFTHLNTRRKRIATERRTVEKLTNKPAPTTHNPFYVPSIPPSDILLNSKLRPGIYTSGMLLMALHLWMACGNLCMLVGLRLEFLECWMRLWVVMKMMTR